MKISKLIIGVLLIIGLVGFVYGQVPTSYPSQPLYKNILVTPNSGYISTDYGDFNGDGIADIAYTFASSIAKIDLYEGQTGNLINSLNISSASAEPYDLISINDINNDGIDEIVIVGNPCPTSSCDRLYFYDGSNGALLQVIQSTSSTGMIGGFAKMDTDIDANGYEEFLFIDYTNTSNQIYIYDTTYSLVSTVPLPPGVSSWIPYSTSGIGDVNGNNVKDFIVGVPGISTTSPSGNAYVYEGADLSIIYTINSSPGGYQTGRYVLGKTDDKLFDYDGDGISDFVVSEASGGVDMARIFSGATGNQIGPSLQGAFSTSFDSSELSADINGDGYSEFLAEGPGIIGHTLYSYSGPNGTIQHHWNYPSQSPTNVLSADFTGDGLGEANLINFQNGSRYIITEKLGGVFSYGSNTLNATWDYNSAVPSTGNIIITGMNPNEQFCIALSDAPSSITLPSGDTVLVDINSPNFSLDCNSLYQADITGTYTINNANIQNSALAGQKLYVQIPVFRGPNIFTSNGLEITFIP